MRRLLWVAATLGIFALGCYSSSTVSDADGAMVDDGGRDDGGLDDGGTDDGRDVPVPVCLTDDDHDRFGEGCPAGPDCDDSDPRCTVDCSDGDGDGTPECADPDWMLAVGIEHTDRFDSVVGLPDGGLAAAGVTDVGGYSVSEPWIVRFDHGGAILWQEMLPLYSYSAWLSQLDLAADGDLFGFGAACAGPDPLDPRYFCGPLLLRFAPDGAVRWARSYSLAEGNGGGFVFVRMPAGELLVAGTRVEYVMAETEVHPWIGRLREDGSIAWQRLLRHADDAWAMAVVATTDGGGIVVGCRRRRIAGADFDVWVVRLDAAGNPEWEKTYATASGDDMGMQVQVLAGGDILVLASAPLPEPDPLNILRLTSSGDLVAVRAFGLAPSCDRCALEVDYTPAANGFLVDGTRTVSSGYPPTESHFPLLTLLDVDAGVVWGRQLGCGNRIDEVTVLPYGRVLLAGLDSVVTATGVTVDGVAASLGPNAVAPGPCAGAVYTVLTEVPAPGWTATESSSVLEDTTVVPLAIDVDPVPTTAVVTWRHP